MEEWEKLKVKTINVPEAIVVYVIKVGRWKLNAYMKPYEYQSQGHSLPLVQSKKISNDQELIQSDTTSCPQNQKGNN